MPFQCPMVRYRPTMTGGLALGCWTYSEHLLSLLNNALGIGSLAGSPAHMNSSNSTDNVNRTVTSRIGAPIMVRM